MIRLKDFRRENKIFQTELAEVLGVSQSAISRMEGNELELTKEQYQKLYDKYGREIIEPYIYEEETDSRLIEILKKGLERLGSQEHDESLIPVLCKQNEIIQNCLEEQRQWTEKYATMNEKLLSILEKLAQHA